MRADDYFKDVPDPTAAVGWATTLELDTSRLEALQRGPVRGRDEVGMAQGVVDLVYEELTAFGTSGGERLANDEIALAIRAMLSVLARLGIPLECMPSTTASKGAEVWVVLNREGIPVVCERSEDLRSP